MKKISLILGLAFVCTVAFAQQKPQTGKPSTGNISERPSTPVVVKGPPSTAPAPTPVNAPTANTTPVNTTQTEYVPGTEKQTSPTANTTPTTVNSTNKTIIRSAPPKKTAMMKSQSTSPQIAK